MPLEITYSEWLEQLAGYAAGWDCVVCDDPSSREMYDDGFTPEDAWQEEMFAASDLT